MITWLSYLQGRSGLTGPAALSVVALFLALLMVAGWQPKAVHAAPQNRGGVAVVGMDSKAKTVADRLRTLNMTWYYDYSANLDDESSGASKVAVLRGGEKNRTLPTTAAAQARRHPGHYWIVFNEPDLEGQDFVTEEFLAAREQSRFDYYADIYHDYVTAIKGADPTAKVVAPNLFNWQGNHRAWIDAFRKSYRTRYGAEPPVDVWALHLYSYDPSWKSLPVLDLDYSKMLYRDFKEYVRSIPGHESTPIWVTELGTIWAYRDLVRGPDSLYRGSNYAWPEVTAFLADILPWLEEEGADRWFVFGTNPVNDPWAGVPNALFLMDANGQPTEAGKLLIHMLVIQASRQ